jgi:epoxyqueuosine reductase QueG
MQWNEEDRREYFRGSSMKRAKLGMIRRNAVIVAGNILAESQDEALKEAITSIAQNPSEDVLVSEAARIVLLQERD